MNPTCCCVCVCAPLPPLPASSFLAILSLHPSHIPPLSPILCPLPVIIILCPTTIFEPVTPLVFVAPTTALLVSLPTHCIRSKQHTNTDTHPLPESPTSHSTPPIPHWPSFATPIPSLASSRVVPCLCKSISCPCSKPSSLAVSAPRPRYQSLLGPPPRTGHLSPPPPQPSQQRNESSLAATTTLTVAAV